MDFEETRDGEIENFLARTNVAECISTGSLEELAKMIPGRFFWRNSQVFLKNGTLTEEQVAEAIRCLQDQSLRRGYDVGYGEERMRFFMMEIDESGVRGNDKESFYQHVFSTLSKFLESDSDYRGLEAVQQFCKFVDEGVSFEAFDNYQMGGKPVLNPRHSFGANWRNVIKTIFGKNDGENRLPRFVPLYNVTWPALYSEDERRHAEGLLTSFNDKVTLVGGEHQGEQNLTVDECEIAEKTSAVLGFMSYVVQFFNAYTRQIFALPGYIIPALYEQEHPSWEKGFSSHMLKEEVGRCGFTRI